MESHVENRKDKRIMDTNIKKLFNIEIKDKNREY